MDCTDVADQALRERQAKEERTISHWNRDVCSTGSDIASWDGNEKDLNENDIRQ